MNFARIHIIQTIDDLIIALIIGPKFTRRGGEGLESLLGLVWETNAGGSRGRFVVTGRHDSLNIGIAQGREKATLESEGATSNPWHDSVTISQS